jgi:hypothetical protein
MDDGGNQEPLALIHPVHWSVHPTAKGRDNVAWTTQACK